MVPATHLFPSQSAARLAQYIPVDCQSGGFPIVQVFQGHLGRKMGAWCGKENARVGGLHLIQHHNTPPLTTIVHNYPARACAARGYVIGRGVYVFIFIYISGLLFGTNLLSKILTLRGLF